MIVAEARAPRELKTVHVAADFVVVGGGLAGSEARHMQLIGVPRQANVRHDGTVLLRQTGEIEGAYR